MCYTGYLTAIYRLTLCLWGKSSCELRGTNKLLKRNRFVTWGSVVSVSSRNVYILNILSRHNTDTFVFYDYIGSDTTVIKSYANIRISSRCEASNFLSAHPQYYQHHVQYFLINIFHLRGL